MSDLPSYLFPIRHAHLIAQLAARTVRARYRQSWLGAAWAVLTPLLMLGVYTFVFRHVFKVRWGAVDEGNLSFALRLYAGLAVFSFVAECISRAPGLVLADPHLVKKVVFPLEVLPWVNALAAGIHLAVALILLLALSFWEQGQWHLTALALPLVWLPLLPLVLGLGWFLAGVGTYVRDTEQVVVMLTSLLMFLSPIFFPVEALPTAWRGWLELNPLAAVITGTRDVLLNGLWPDWSALTAAFGACFLLTLVGAAFFRVARRGFADVV
jgi:lipopolysaccharide transport system permease protein